MNNIIIECSRFDAIDATSNATWKTELPKGITINNGDIITLRNCFINSATSDADNIEIEEDTQLSFTLGYYDVNMSTDNTTSGVATLDYDFYVAYLGNVGTVSDLEQLTFRGFYDGPETFLDAMAVVKDNSGVQHRLVWGNGSGAGYPANMPPARFPIPPPGEDHSTLTVNAVVNNAVVSSLKVTTPDSEDIKYSGATWNDPGQGGLTLNTGTVEIIIPQGQYTRAGLAKFITDKLQFAKPMYENTNVLTGSDFMRRTDDFKNHIPIDSDLIINDDERRTVTLTEPFDSLGLAFQTGLYYDVDVTVVYHIVDEDDFDNTIVNYETVNTTIESIENGGIVIAPDGTVTVTFVNDIFELNLDYDLAYIIVDTPESLNFKRVGFSPADPATKSYSYNPLGSYYYGSSENVLIYDEDRSVFAWQYLHMPYYGTADPTIAIKQFRNVDVANPEAYNKYYTITQLGGVFFLNLEPVSFWEQLGFNINQLIVPTQPDQSILREDLLSRITYGYSSLASLLNIANPKVAPSGALDQDIATTDTVQIVGSSLDNISTGGFWLVSANFGNQKYMFQKGNKSSIQAIVSKYNQIRNFVTGYSDASVNYQHSGAPFDLQTISISILDPETKLPDTNVGDKSSIFIQITRA